MGTRAALTDRLFEPIDAATLGLFRIGFGILMFWETFRFWPRVESEYLATKCPFRYDFFDWIPTFSEFGLNAVFTAMAISAALVTIGFLYRVAAIAFFASYTYVFLIDQTLYNNHYYLTSLFAFFFAVVNADAAFSLNRLVRRRPILTRFLGGTFLFSGRSLSSSISMPVSRRSIPIGCDANQCGTFCVSVPTIFSLPERSTTNSSCIFFRTAACCSIFLLDFFCFGGGHEFLASYSW